MRMGKEFPAWLRRRGYGEATKERIAKVLARERVPIEVPKPPQGPNVIPFLVAQIVRRGAEAPDTDPAIRRVIAFPTARMLPTYSAVLSLACQVGEVGSQL